MTSESVSCITPLTLKLCQQTWVQKSRCKLPKKTINILLCLVWRVISRRCSQPLWQMAITPIRDSSNDQRQQRQLSWRGRVRACESETDSALFEAWPVVTVHWNHVVIWPLGVCVCVAYEQREVLVLLRTFIHYNQCSYNIFLAQIMKIV
jgi:hypothetical protein